MTKEINNWELIYCTSKRDSLNTRLRIIFQDLNLGKLYLIDLDIDSIMCQVLDDRQKKGTTNDLINSIIKKSIHKAKLIENIQKLREYIWNPLDFDSIQNKIRDIKINQIII